MKHINADELVKFCTSMLVEAKDDLIIQTHNNCFRRMREYIKSLPSVDVRENIHGEWINKRTMQHDGEFYCSVCDFELDSFTQGVFYNYCPNCGADMRERIETE